MIRIILFQLNWVLQNTALLSNKKGDKTIFGLRNSQQLTIEYIV